MQRVTLIEDILDPAGWERLEVEDARILIRERFPQWPATAKIYQGAVAQDHEVTPRSRAEVDRLATYDDLFVIIYPEAPILIAAAVVAVVVVLAIVFLLPAIPDLSNQQTTSPNNSLSERGNQARPFGRIPDIFGQVHSTPDLIAVSYRVFENHRELEISFMCIGRGSYLVEKVRDGDTLIENIDGASVAIYGPGTSPNSGDAPQLQIGTAIGDPLFDVRRLNEINGQTMKAPNDEAVRAANEIRFADGGLVQAGSGIDFTEFFEPGDPIDIGGAVDDGTTEGALQQIVSAMAIAGGSLQFSVFNPSLSFKLGQLVTITSATWGFSTGAAAGDTPVVLNGGKVADRFGPEP